MAPVVRVSVAPGAANRTRNMETFGALKLFPPIGEQDRQVSRADDPVDLYLVIWSSLSANAGQLHPNTPVGFGIGLTKIGSRSTHLHAFLGQANFHSTGRHWGENAERASRWGKSAQGRMARHRARPHCRSPIELASQPCAFWVKTGAALPAEGRLRLGSSRSNKATA